MIIWLLAKNESNFYSFIMILNYFLYELEIIFFLIIVIFIKFILKAIFGFILYIRYINLLPIASIYRD